MNTPTTPVRVPITDPVEKRVAMINGMFQLPEPTIKAMKRIREASEEYARELKRVFESLDKKDVDVGRAIATIDHIQQTKNIACDALILPHATREVETEGSFGVKLIE